MGFVGIALITGGIILVWSGTQNVKPLDVLRAVLTGQAVPRATPKDSTGDAADQPGYGWVDPGTGKDGQQLPPVQVPPGQHLV